MATLSGLGVLLAIAALSTAARVDAMMPVLGPRAESTFTTYLPLASKPLVPPVWVTGTLVDNYRSGQMAGTVDELVRLQGDFSCSSWPTRTGILFQMRVETLSSTIKSFASESRHAGVWQLPDNAPRGKVLEGYIEFGNSSTRTYGQPAVPPEDIPVVMAQGQSSYLCGQDQWTQLRPVTWTVPLHSNLSGPTAVHIPPGAMEIAANQVSIVFYSSAPFNPRFWLSPTAESTYAMSTFELNQDLGGGDIHLLIQP